MTRSGSILTALAGTLLLTVVSTAATPAAGVAPATGGTRAPRADRAHKDANIRVATYNVEYASKPRALVRDVRRLTDSGVSIIALQEMGGRERRDRLRAALVDCDGCRYNAYMPEPGGPAVTPILFRSDRFDRLDAGNRRVTKETKVGPQGAGPRVVHAKYVDHVTLRELSSGRRIAVLNTHLVASVQARDGGANRRMEERVRLYRRHMRGLRAVVRELRQSKPAVVVTGDFNVNYRKDRVVQDPVFPFSQMHRVEASATYQTLGEPELGTHTLPSGVDTRLIDHIYLARHGAVTPVRQRVLEGFRSDHRPLVVRFHLDAVRR